MSKEPSTLMEAVRHFADPDIALKTMVELRWPEGVHCPTCGRADVKFLPTRRLWECKEKHSRKQFSAKVGTIFEDSPLGLDKWFVAVWSIANCKNGISSYELARAIGVTQKSAWHMLHRIRLAMKVGNLDKVDGIAEVDETYVGGKKTNMHRSKAKKVSGRGAVGKAIVMGVLKRGDEKSASRVRAMLIENASIPNIQGVVRDNVEPGSQLMTDAHGAYQGLSAEYQHEFTNHMVEYVRGAVHTNGIENFWSLLKRSLKGSYVSVDPAHLSAYVDEQAFRFNERKLTDAERFRAVTAATKGKRLRYKDLTGHVETALPA